MRAQGKGIKCYVESDYAPLKAAMVGNPSSIIIPDISKWEMANLFRAEDKHITRNDVGKVRIVQNDVGRFASEFLGHSFDSRCSVDGNCGARAGRTGNGHHVDVFVCGHRCAHGRAFPENKVENTGRNARSIHNLR